jgi:hypothetical protein
MWRTRDFVGTPERSATQYLTEFLNQTGLTKNDFQVIGLLEHIDQRVLLLYWEPEKAMNFPTDYMPCQEDPLRDQWPS